MHAAILLTSHHSVSWLHVGVANNRPIELYRRMGFRMVRKVTLNRISRTD
jgi:hypothetical protein